MEDLLLLVADAGSIGHPAHVHLRPGLPEMKKKEYFELLAAQYNTFHTNVQESASEDSKS